MKQPVAEYKTVLTTGTKLFRSIIILEVGGKLHNIFVKDEKDYLDFADSILNNKEK